MVLEMEVPLALASSMAAVAVAAAFSSSHPGDGGRWRRSGADGRGILLSVMSSKLVLGGYLFLFLSMKAQCDLVDDVEGALQTGAVSACDDNVLNCTSCAAPRYQQASNSIN
jgi:hypothetical protein